MCGLAGLASMMPAVEQETLVRMRDAMAHRGPDDAGIWISADARIGLAHRRLSVIDLSAAGHQPMTDARGAIQLAYNGEVYNFLELRRKLEGLGRTFRTRTDTEVVLEAYREWGRDFVGHLEGMFALALYDPSRRELLLARDRVGEKPLFVWQTAKQLAFASELKALFQLPGFPRTLDPAALDSYLAYGYVPRERCLLQGVTKLPPAHLLVYDVDEGTARMTRYWDLPRNTSQRADDAHELVCRLEHVLARSVARQTVADVPVAIMLSGGLDSSIVTALAARSVSKVRTFTVTFPGAGHYDEAEHARAVARHFATDHIEVEARPANVDLLPVLARQFDEPIADSSMVPTYILSLLIREHATVALGGDGGDELFGGYPHYAWLQRAEPLLRTVPRAFRQAVSVAARVLPVGFRGRNYAFGLGDRGRGILGRVNIYFDPATRERILGRSSPSWPETVRVAAGADGRSLLDAAQRMDFRSYLPDDILVKLDRASMLASLEVRAPFLDVHVVELAFGSVPENLKVSGRERKILLRRLGERILPRELDLGRKQGFSMPLRPWFSGPWGQFMREVLTDGQSPFDPRAVEQLFAEQHRRGGHEQRLFALAIFELWRREYEVRVSHERA